VVTNAEVGVTAHEEVMTVKTSPPCVDFLLVALLFVTNFILVSTN
jgi:hypothetical protein